MKKCIALLPVGTKRGDVIPEAFVCLELSYLLARLHTDVKKLKPYKCWCDNSVRLDYDDYTMARNIKVIGEVDILDYTDLKYLHPGLAYLLFKKLGISYQDYLQAGGKPCVGAAMFCEDMPESEAEAFLATIAPKGIITLLKAMPARNKAIAKRIGLI